MSTIYYAVSRGDSYELYEELEFAIKSRPKYIFSLRSIGITKSVFPERTVENEHFIIDYLNSKGEKATIEKKGWKAYDIVDPERYGMVLKLKIRDPEGIIRLFDSNRQAHYENRFHNSIGSLIELVNFIKYLSQFKNWKEFEKKTK